MRRKADSKPKRRRPGPSSRVRKIKKGGGGIVSSSRCLVSAVVKEVESIGKEWTTRSRVQKKAYFTGRGRAKE